MVITVRNIEKYFTNLLNKYASLKAYKESSVLSLIPRLNFMLENTVEPNLINLVKTFQQIQLAYNHIHFYYNLLSMLIGHEIKSNTIKIIFDANSDLIYGKTRAKNSFEYLVKVLFKQYKEADPPEIITINSRIQELIFNNKKMQLMMFTQQ